MVNAGRVGLIPKGEFDPNVKYEKLDIVSYQNKGYIAKEKDIPIGTLPTDEDYWLLSFDIDGVAKVVNPEFEGSVISNKAPYDNALDSSDIKKACQSFSVTNFSQAVYSNIVIDLTNYPTPTIDTSEPITFFVRGYDDSGKNITCELTYELNGVSFIKSRNFITIQGTPSYFSVWDTESGADITNTKTIFEIKSLLIFDTNLKLLFHDISSVKDESVALGVECLSVGKQSQAFGLGSVAVGDRQLVIGKYNKNDIKNEYAFIIGSGLNGTSRNNSFAITKGGEIEQQGYRTSSARHSTPVMLPPKESVEYELVSFPYGTDVQIKNVYLETQDDVHNKAHYVGMTTNGIIISAYYCNNSIYARLTNTSSMAVNVMVRDSVATESSIVCEYKYQKE